MVNDNLLIRTIIPRSEVSVCLFCLSVLSVCPLSELNVKVFHKVYVSIIKFGLLLENINFIHLFW